MSLVRLLPFILNPAVNAKSQRGGATTTTKGHSPQSGFIPPPHDSATYDSATSSVGPMKLLAESWVAESWGKQSFQEIRTGSLEDFFRSIRREPDHFSRPSIRKAVPAGMVTSAWALSCLSRDGRTGRGRWPASARWLGFQ